MGDELRIRAQITYYPANVNQRVIDSGMYDLFVDIAGDAHDNFVQEIGTSEEQLGVSADIATQGYWFIVNLDEDNFVAIGKTGQRCIKIMPGKLALFQSLVDMYGKADTAAVKISGFCVEI